MPDMQGPPLTPLVFSDLESCSWWSAQHFIFSCSFVFSLYFRVRVFLSLSLFFFLIASFVVVHILCGYFQARYILSIHFPYFHQTYQKSWTFSEFSCQQQWLLLLLASEAKCASFQTTQSAYKL
jgi:hypothetical protein